MKPNIPKKLQSLLIETATQRVIRVLCSFPEKEFSLSDLAKEAGVAKPHIGRILDRLLDVNFIEITKLSKIWRIKANQQEFRFIKAKIIYNLDFLYNSGIVELLNVRFENPRAIILFGSFRRGEDLSNSDIDIAIETGTEQEYQVLGLKELAEFERAIHRKIQLHVFHRDHIDLNVFNNIANGIVLAGFLEVRP